MSMEGSTLSGNSFEWSWPLEIHTENPHAYTPQHCRTRRKKFLTRHSEGRLTSSAASCFCFTFLEIANSRSCFLAGFPAPPDSFQFRGSSSPSLGGFPFPARSNIRRVSDRLARRIRSWKYSSIRRAETLSATATLIDLILLLPIPPPCGLLPLMKAVAATGIWFFS
jgi:hypothetical protein